MEKDLSILRHSTSHLMAAAVLELFPGTKVAIGPSIEEGFYYDFDRKEPFTVDDLSKIEEKMHELAKKDDPFICTTVKKEDAIKRAEEAEGRAKKTEEELKTVKGNAKSFRNKVFAFLRKHPVLEKAFLNELNGRDGQSNVIEGPQK